MPLIYIFSIILRNIFYKNRNRHRFWVFTSCTCSVYFQQNSNYPLYNDNTVFHGKHHFYGVPWSTIFTYRHIHFLIGEYFYIYLFVNTLQKDSNVIYLALTNFFILVKAIPASKDHKNIFYRYSNKLKINRNSPSRLWAWTGNMLRHTCPPPASGGASVTFANLARESTAC